MYGIHLLACSDFNRSINWIERNLESSNCPDIELDMLFNCWGLLTKIYYNVSGLCEQDHLLSVDGMTNLFSCPLWSPIWVLQEISLTQKGNTTLYNRYIFKINLFIPELSIHYALNISRTYELPMPRRRLTRP